MDKHKKKCITIKDLPTLEEYSKKLDPSVRKLYIHTRFTGLIDRCTVEGAVSKYGKDKVFNYLDKEPGIVDVYLGHKEVEYK